MYSPDIRIFFPNGKAVQFSVEDGAHASSTALLDLMAEHLQIDNEVANDAFALWFISPLLELQLKPHHMPFEVHEKWPIFLEKFAVVDENEIALDEPLLVIRRNFQLIIENERLYIEEYERLTEVLYLDAKDQYMTGRYLVDVEAALELAALQLSIDFEPFESVEKALDLIQDNLGLLVPTQHISKVRSFRLFGLAMMECKSGLENALMTEYRVVSEHSRNNNERRRMFLSILQKTPFYGAAFFTGKTRDRKNGFFSFFWHQPNNVTIGINHEYITIVNCNRHELLTCEQIANCSWNRSSSLGTSITTNINFFSSTNDEIPLFVLQYPDSPVLSEENGDKSGITNFISVEFKKNASLGIEKWNGNVVIVEETELKKSLPLVNRQIFSKQAVMIEALLNTLYNELYAKTDVVK